MGALVKTGIVTLALLGAAAIVLSGGNPMAKLVLFSEVRGVVLSEGRPVGNAVVEREYVWGNKTGRDSTTTNGAGEFQLPAIRKTSVLSSILPHQPFIEQTIIIRHVGNEYHAWMFDKKNYRENGERAGRPIVLRCSLESPVKDSPEGIAGICDLM